MSSILLGLAALAATTYAHGTVSGIVADGVYSGGFKLDYYYSALNGQAVPDTPGWYAENLDNGFIAPAAYNTSDINCHKNSKNAKGLATVKAGGSLSFEWTAWPASHVGPTISYFASCGDDCATVDKTTLKWVKYQADGYTDGKWAAVEMIANNNTVDTTVPATLAPGKYVFRHEIIALHSAGSENGAQNYPQCLNVEVTGSGTESPEGTLGTELYKSTDAGILFNVYAATIDYSIPGPELFVAGGAATPATPATPVSSGAASPASATSAAAAAATSATATPAAAEPVPSSSAAPASPTPSTATGSEETYTVESFIAWLEEQTGTTASKVRRHARQFM